MTYIEQSHNINIQGQSGLVVERENMELSPRMNNILACLSIGTNSIELLKFYHNPIRSVDKTNSDIAGYPNIQLDSTQLYTQAALQRCNELANVGFLTVHKEHSDAKVFSLTPDAKVIGMPLAAITVGAEATLLQTVSSIILKSTIERSDPHPVKSSPDTQELFIANFIQPVSTIIKEHGEVIKIGGEAMNIDEYIREIITNLPAYEQYIAQLYKNYPAASPDRKALGLEIANQLNKNMTYSPEPVSPIARVDDLQNNHSFSPLYETNDPIWGPIYKELSKHHNSLLHYARRLIGDADEAEDVVQQVWLKAFLSKEKLNSQQNVKAWLFRVTYSTSIDELRRRRNIRFSELEKSVEEGENSLLDNLLDTNPQPYEYAEQAFLRNKIQSAIQSLPAKFRMVMWLRYTSNFSLSFTDIGEILQIPAPTVKTYYYRAQRLMGTSLEELVEI